MNAMPASGVLLALLLAACAPADFRSDPGSDAPEARIAPSRPLIEAASWAEALQRWHAAEDVNAWIAARFEYDPPRAMALSETQRAATGGIAIHAPEAFFTRPSGICVDLARFAVETLRAIEPASRPRYVMIEFSPVAIAGNTLRRHWVASYERDGARYFFADSKRPGHVAGPYASTADFIRDYAAYRQREVVAFRDLDTYERRRRIVKTGTDPLSPKK